MFGNIILTNTDTAGILQDDCGSELRTQVLPNDPSTKDFLFVSSNIIINGLGQAIQTDIGCEGLSEAREVNPFLRLMPRDASETSALFDPTTGEFIDKDETLRSPSFTNVDEAPADAFFDRARYHGAFGSDDLWIAGWSLLASTGQISAQTASSSSDDGNDGFTGDVVVGVAIALGVLAALIIGVIVYFMLIARSYQSEYDKMAGRKGADEENGTPGGKEVAMVETRKKPESA
uniref:Uncharacterized protein n=1 Tax=Pinguiococcus pyrenoidosus TaxID=172671 RepID=A0A7R9YE84_9STRA|mmetsp:Transcript_6428/g.24937  ORF Transcript_6428/g.24937 Transcript_6428/m.24937 type:complete len:233 (+) Transcript_6428:2-700(+)